MKDYRLTLNLPNFEMFYLLFLSINHIQCFSAKFAEPYFTLDQIGRGIECTILGRKHNNTSSLK